MSQNNQLAAMQNAAMMQQMGGGLYGSGISQHEYEMRRRMDEQRYRDMMNSDAAAKQQLAVDAQKRVGDESRSRSLLLIEEGN